MSPCQCAALIKNAGGRHGSKIAGGSQRAPDAPPNAARQQRAERYREQRASSRGRPAASQAPREQQRASSRPQRAGSRQRARSRRASSRPAARQSWSDEEWRHYEWRQYHDSQWQYSPLSGWWNFADWQEGHW